MTVKIFDTKDIAIFKFALNSFNFIIIDPQTTRSKESALTLLNINLGHNYFPVPLPFFASSGF